ncbi:hypothetical protein B0T18DRAFT_415596 [Schizothecium vesticola]|uniref:Uncharacterized protein n=1 Tax=Schizothecium vesticola TaxID=314040 RepID=A0AA40EQH0_9PEZI|nr:hypothetical protein B0T18DRAFT_415596 [Schizothecium vesticola]
MLSTCMFSMRRCECIPAGEIIFVARHDSSFIHQPRLETGISFRHAPNPTPGRLWFLGQIHSTYLLVSLTFNIIKTHPFNPKHQRKNNHTPPTHDKPWAAVTYLHSKCSPTSPTTASVNPANPSSSSPPPSSTLPPTTKTTTTTSATTWTALPTATLRSHPRGIPSRAAHRHPHPHPAGTTSISRFRRCHLRPSLLHVPVVRPMLGKSGV